MSENYNSETAMENHQPFIVDRQSPTTICERSDVEASLNVLSSGSWRALLTQAFLVGLPCSRGLWARAAEAMPQDLAPLQQGILGHLSLLSTVHHPLALRYPRDTGHSLASLLWLQDVFAKRGWVTGCFDELIDRCRLHLQQNDQPELAYKSYILDGSCWNNCYEYGSLDYDMGLIKQNMKMLTNGSVNSKSCIGKKNGDHTKTVTGDTHLEILENNRYNCNAQNPELDTNSQCSFVNILENSNEKEDPHKHRSSQTPQISLCPFKEYQFSIFHNQECRFSPSFDQEIHLQNRVPAGTGGHVTLLEAVEGIARGTTGLTSWGGGAVMAEWLDNNKQLLNGKRILELGAGVGYMAAALLKSSTTYSASSQKSQKQCSLNCSTETNTAGNISNNYEDKNFDTELIRKELSNSSTATNTADNFINNVEDKKFNTEHMQGGLSICSAAAGAENNYSLKQSEVAGELSSGKLSSSASSSSASNGPAAYTATDCHPHVLDLLFHNLSLMADDEAWDYRSLCHHRRQLCERLSREELPPGDAALQPWRPPNLQLSVMGVPVQVRHLDWRTPDLSALPSADVILAADIVYARHLLEPLARLLRSLLSKKPANNNTVAPDSKTSAANNNTVAPDSNTSAANNNTVAPDSKTSAANSSPPLDSTSSSATAAYIACTRRSSETVTEFLSALSEQRLSYSLVYQATLDTESALFVYNESHIPVKVYKIMLDDDSENNSR